MPEKVRTKCGNCNQTLKVPQTILGRRVRCPSCKQHVLLAGTSNDGSTQSAVSVDPSASSRSYDNSNAEPEISKSTNHVREQATLRMVGRFELKEEIGQGGFGQVFRAYDSQLDRQLAIKVPKFAPNEKKKIRRFLSEARAAASLRHPNIVAVYERGRADGEYYIASEFIEGETLTDSISQQIPDFRTAALWVRDMANALAYAHAENVIHRDIKSDNIMIGTNQRPQLMDFGLAKRLNEDSSMTADGGLLGTPAYMSPEQARGETQNVGPKSDQYSLGVVLYELLVGRKPFEGPPHSIITKVTLEEPPTPQSLNANVPDDLQAICLKAMSKETKHRYSNLTKMEEDLDRWLDGYETIARPISSVERLVRWCRRNKLVAGLGTAFIMTLLTGIVASSYFAVDADRERIVAQEAQTSAESAQREAEKQQQAAIASRELAKRRLAESFFDRAITLMEDDQFSRAFATLVLSEETAPKSATNLRRAIRLNMAAIYRRVERSRAYVVHRVRAYASPSFSRDGRRVVAGSGDGVIRVWDPLTGETLSPEILHPQQNNSVLRDVAISPDGRRLVSVCTAGHVFMWNCESGEQFSHHHVKLNTGGPQIGGVTFHPDGSLFATGHWSGHVQLWNSETGEPHGEPLRENTSNGSMVKFSPDGQLLATSGKIQIWNVESGQLLEKQPPDTAQGAAIAISADGRYLAWGGRFDETGRVWDIQAGEPVGSPLPDQIRTQQIAFHPNGNWLFTSGKDNILRVWDIAASRYVSNDHLHSLPLSCMAMSPDGRYLLTGSSTGRFKMRSIESLGFEGVFPTFDNGQTSRGIAFSPDGRLLATGNQEQVHVWNAENNALVRKYDANIAFASLGFSYDGRYLVGGQSRKVHVWDPESESTTGKVLVSPKGFLGYAFSFDSRFFATAARDGRIRVWELATGELVGEPIKQIGTTIAVGFDQMGKHVLGVTLDGRSSRWDLNNGQAVGDPFQHEKRITWPSAFSPDGKTLVTSTSTDHRSGLWNWKGTKWIGPHQLPGHHTHEARVVFSEDSQHVLVSGGSRVTIWDTATGQRFGKEIELSQQTSHLKWAIGSKDFVLTSSQLNGIRIWDIQSGRPVGPPVPNNPASDAAIDFHGRYFTTESNDGKTRVHTIFPPLKEDLADLKLWIEAMTAFELTANDKYRSLNHDEWYSRLQKVNENN